MSKKLIYLGCPHCDWKVLKSVLIGKKWNPEKTIICDECESESELSEWTWFEKHEVPYFRVMSMGELREFVHSCSEKATEK